MCTTFDDVDDDVIEAMFHRRYKLLRMRINICDPMTLSWPQWKRQRKHLKCNSMFILLSIAAIFCCDSFIEKIIFVSLQCLYLKKAGMSVLADELDNFTLDQWSAAAAADRIFHSHVQYMHSVCDMSPCAWYVLGFWRIHFKIHLSCSFHLSMLLFALFLVAFLSCFTAI